MGLKPVGKKVDLTKPEISPRYVFYGALAVATLMATVGIGVWLYGKVSSVTKANLPSFADIEARLGV